MSISDATILDESGHKIPMPGTDWYELHGSPILNIDEKGAHGVRLFRVKARSRIALIRGLRGSPIRRLPPDQFPELVSENGNQKRLFCIAVNMTPFKGARGDPDQFNKDAHGNPLYPKNPHEMTSEWWMVEARYEVPVTIDYTMAGEFAHFPTAALHFFSPEGEQQVIPAEGIGTVLPHMELSITRKNVATWNPDQTSLLLGCINNADFSALNIENAWRSSMDLPDITYGLGAGQFLPVAPHPPGTVLYLGSTPTMLIDAWGDPTWDISYKFAIRPAWAPWNKMFNHLAAQVGATKAELWQDVYFTIEGSAGPPSTAEQLYTPYLPADLMGLFR